MTNVFQRAANLWLIIALMIAVAGILTPAFTQSSLDTAAVSAEWERTATRAQNAIDAGRASDAALEELRAQLVEWRARFQGAQEQNANEIRSVQAQIQALGPEPENTVEAAEVTDKRATLATRLGALQGPIKVAEASQSRADGLIHGVDQIIRDRQTDALLKIGPSPLDLANWPIGAAAFFGSASSVGNEFENALMQPAQMASFKQEIPTFSILLVIGLALLIRGRRWAERWAQTVQEKRPTARRWLLGFLLSLGQIALPLLGLVFVTEAIYATGLVGLRSDILLSVMPVAGFQFFFANWLGARLFSKSEKTDPPLRLTALKRREGRLYAWLIGLVLATQSIVLVVAGFENWPDEARVVVLFGPMVLAAVLILRVSRLIMIHANEDVSDDDDRTYRIRLTRALSRVLAAIAIVGPLLAAIGYFQAATALIYPTISSLLLIGVLLVLQRLITEIYILFTGNRETAKESLIPVVVGFVLVSASTPVFALIWGARLADITEMWARFKKGVSIGETEISPTIFITFAVVFAVGYIITRLVQGTLRNTILPKTKIDVGGQNALVTGIGYIGIFLAALIAINGAGIDLSSLAIVAGALSVGIGFGLQNIVSNFVSGIILLIERPISEGDWIEVGGEMGYVRDISVRSTRIETFDRTDVIVPNSDLVSGTVTNFTRGNTIGRVIVPVGVAYGSDTRFIESILLDIAKAHPMVLANPAPFIVFQGFGADSMDFEIRAILRDVNWVLSVRSDMNHEIARRFAEEGVEIPFAQRDVWLRNPESLQPGSRADTPPEKPDRSQVKQVRDDDLPANYETADAEGEGSDR